MRLQQASCRYSRLAMSLNESIALHKAQLGKAFCILNLVSRNRGQQHQPGVFGVGRLTVRPIA